MKKTILALFVIALGSNAFADLNPIDELADTAEAAVATTAHSIYKVNVYSFGTKKPLDYKIIQLDSVLNDDTSRTTILSVESDHFEGGFPAFKLTPDNVNGRLRKSIKSIKKLNKQEALEVVFYDDLGGEIKVKFQFNTDKLVELK